MSPHPKFTSNYPKPTSNYPKPTSSYSKSTFHHTKLKSTFSYTEFTHKVSSATPTVHFITCTSSDNVDDSDASSLTSLPSDASDVEMDSNDGRIPKPTGEAGRLKCGGYTLKVTLNWTAKDYMA